MAKLNPTEMAGYDEALARSDAEKAMRDVAVAAKAPAPALALVPGVTRVAKVLLPVPPFTALSRYEVIVPNPKRPGTAAWSRFDLMASGETVADYALKVGPGLARAELTWCVKRGFCRFVEAEAVASV